jgi:hypothetical protein
MGVGGQSHVPATLPPHPFWFPNSHRFYRRRGGPQGRRTGADNSALTEIRSPDRPAPSQLLYRLSYRGSCDVWFLHETTTTILYIELNVCLFVCLHIIQIHISEPISTKLCTHLPLGLEETTGYVCSENVWPFLPFSPSSSGAISCRGFGTHSRQRRWKR